MKETIDYLRKLKKENYTFSNFNLDDVLNYIDDLENKVNEALKYLEDNYAEQLIGYANYVNLKKILEDNKQ